MTNPPNKTLLLSSVCKPFGTKYSDGFGVSSEGTHQIMWAQGVFRTRATTTQWGTDFIAENLKIPTTSLHYPTMSQFIAEIKQGYDYVGIAFVASTLHKMIPMVEAVRKHAPSTQIILGGYGTALGDEIKKYADYVCRGEGVSFMRKLLGEKVEAPIVQPDITQRQTLFSIPLRGATGYVFAGLGCPNGCDFCATSHYFKQQHIQFLPDGPSILSAIERLRAKHPGMDKFWINDEDFLLDEERGRGFLEAIRKSELPPLSISIFSSVKALSKYSAEELVEMGVDWIWVGYEGKRSGFPKQQGKSYRELFRDFHQHGISVLASMILGFDYHTPQIIEEEFEELLSLRPSMCQFLIYGPSPDTPLQKRLKAEGRLIPELLLDPQKHDGFTLVFEHPHIGQQEMSLIQRRLYQEEFQRLGPSVFRVAEDWLTGYVHLKDHAQPRVRAKAQRYKTDSHGAMTLLPQCKKYVNQKTQAWMDSLEQRLAVENGPLTLKEKFLARTVIPALIRYADFKLRHDIGQQPEFTRKTFRRSGSDRKR